MMDDAAVSETASADAVIFLVEGAQKGNKASFERLIAMFQDEIFRMIYYRTRSLLDAEDLTQDVCIRAYKNIHRLAKSDRFRAWIFGIAINRVRDFYRKRQFLRFFGDSRDENTLDSLEAQPSQHSPAERLYNKEFWRHIHNLSETLSPMEKEVFFLRFMDHLNIKEISQALGKNESTIKTHLYRALKKFKENDVLIEMLQRGAEEHDALE
jgi:RNA polymerase sigma-70 factor (ECF subfamily)